MNNTRIPDKSQYKKHIDHEAMLAFLSTCMGINGNILCTKKFNYGQQKSKATSFGQQSFRWLVPKIWNQVFDQWKSIDILAAFQNQV